jgi:hypothetical protein
VLPKLVHHPTDIVKTLGAATWVADRAQSQPGGGSAAGGDHPAVTDRALDDVGGDEGGEPKDRRVPVTSDPSGAEIVALRAGRPPHARRKRGARLV